MPLSREQALESLASDDLIGLGMEADALRRRLHPEGVVTYTLGRVLPWPASAKQAQELEQAIDDARAMGASSLRLIGAVPQQGLAWFQALLQGLKAHSPQLSVAAFTAADIAALASRLSLAVPALLETLQNAGLDTLAPPSAPEPLAVALDVHRAAHALGMPTLAAFVYGAGESREALVDHLLALRALQQQTAGFAAALPRAFQPRSTADGDEPTAVEVLKVLALTRLVLDNVPHLQADPAAQGAKLTQMTFRFGVNDAGALDLPPRRGHNSNLLTEEELRRTIRDAGFAPAERDALFRCFFLA